MTVHFFVDFCCAFAFFDIFGFFLHFPLISSALHPCSMVGTGDATAANLLAMMHHGKDKSIAEIVNSVLFTMNHVVDTTFRYYEQQIAKNPGMCEVGKHDAKELQLVRCQKEIRFDSKKVTKKFDIEKLL